MKRRNRKPVLPIYLCAALWLLLGLFCPGLLLKGWGLAAAAALSTALYFAACCRISRRNRWLYRKHSSGFIKERKQTAHAGE